MSDKQKKPALLFAEEETTSRNCENCAHAKPFGGENDNRCDAWECEFIDRQEAIEGWKNWRDFLAINCETCEHYGERTDDKMNTHAVCWAITEGHPRRDPDDFCSYWEEKEGTE